ncbi:MAG: hypothetical protein V1685_06195 [Parcubacteria group bacterium]
MLVVVTALVGEGQVSVRDAQAGPLVQVVELNGYRPRFDGSPDTLFVRYMLIDPSNAVPADGFAPLDPIAVLMLFIGGNGKLNLAPGQQNTGSTNFVARTRYHSAAERYVVALVDAASDFLDLGSGLTGHRQPQQLHGDKYLLDLAAVMSDLRTRYPTLPLWAVGTSRGTIGAAVSAAYVAPSPDGIVLTSSLTGPSGVGDLQTVDLESIAVPALIVTHQDDECSATKPEDSKTLKHRFTSSPRVQVLIFNGGSAPLSAPCDPLAGHGFFGVEQKVIEAITKWIEHAER